MDKYKEMMIYIWLIDICPEAFLPTARVFNIFMILDCNRDPIITRYLKESTLHKKNPLL